jgi:hypothetical protein
MAARRRDRTATSPKGCSDGKTEMY